jgi:hypothetical protein
MKKLFIILPLALILCFMVGCQDKAAKWQGTIEEKDGITVVKNPSEPWYGEEEFWLEEEKVIGKGKEDDEPFLMITYLAVDDEENLYVPDTRACNIRVFDKNGNPLRTIGRRGEGPGELIHPSEIQILSQEQIVVTAQQSLHFFSLQGEFLRRVNTSSVGFVKPIFNTRGEIIAGQRIRWDEGSRVLSIFDSELNVMRTLATRPLLTRRPKVNYWEMRWSYNPLVWGVIKDDRIVWGDRANYEIHFISSEGHHLKTITKDYKAREMTEEDEKRLLDEWFDGNPPPPGYTFEFPKYFPAFHNFVCDEEGNLFVQTWEETEDGIGVNFDLFNTEGKYLARMPLKLRNYTLKKGKLYTIEEDEDGYYCVRCYRFAQNV